MKVEHTTTIVLFKALGTVVSLLRQSAILLRRECGDRLRDLIHGAAPIGRDSAHVFSFFLDAELPDPTTTAQVSLNLTIEIEIRGEDRYAAVGSIGWQTREKRGSAIPSSWEYLDLPEFEASCVIEFFEGLPTYVEDLIAKHQQALRDYLAGPRGH